MLPATPAVSPRWSILIGLTGVAGIVLGGALLLGEEAAAVVSMEDCDEPMVDPALEEAPDQSLRLPADGLAETVGNSIDSWFADHPTRRLYVQLDRPLYRPGEEVWVKSWDLRTRDLSGEEGHEGMLLELVNTRGAVVASKQVEASLGRATNDLSLPADAPGGAWTLRATTTEGERLERVFIVDNYEAPRIRKQLDFAREAYGPGELVNAVVTLQGRRGPLVSTEVEALVQVNGEILSRTTLTTDEDGAVLVSARLPEELGAGKGLLTVLVDAGGVTESISRSIPILLQDLELAFFPEGGELVDALPGRVYFEATDAHGQPADVKGRIEDDQGQTVARFRSLHDGLGRFDLKPEPGRSYTAIVEAPAGIAERYTLPAAQAEGCVLRTFDDIEGELSALRASVRCTTPQQVVVTGSLREELLDSATVEAGPDLPGVVYLEALDDKLGNRQGVARVTVFDTELRPRAERVVYRNPDQGLKVEITADQERYGPRDEVNLTVRTLDAEGLPVQAEVALSVVDDRVLEHADDERGHILSRLYLEAEIPGEIDDPAWYYDEDEALARRGLDLLMGTKGYRRFNWVQVLDTGSGLLVAQGEGGWGAAAGGGGVLPTWEDLGLGRVEHAWTVDQDEVWLDSRGRAHTKAQMEAAVAQDRARRDAVVLQNAYRKSQRTQLEARLRTTTDSTALSKSDASKSQNSTSGRDLGGGQVAGLGGEPGTGAKAASTATGSPDPKVPAVAAAISEAAVVAQPQGGAPLQDRLARAQEPEAEEAFRPAKEAEARPDEPAEPLSEEKLNKDKKKGLLAGLLGTRGGNRERAEDAFADEDEGVELPKAMPEAQAEDRERAARDFSGEDLDAEVLELKALGYLQHDGDALGGLIGDIAGGEGKAGFGVGGGGIAGFDQGNMAGRGDAAGFGRQGPAAMEPAGKATLGNIDLPDANANALHSVVRRYQGQVKYCYESLLKSDPSLSGRMDLNLTVKDGRVLTSKVTNDSTSDDSLARCVELKARRWRFPADSGEVELALPFVFEATGYQEAAALALARIPADEAVPRVRSFKKQVTPRWAAVREFPTPDYKDGAVATRTDFRDTVYWAPSVQTDDQGFARVSFHLSDATTTFAVVAEGVGEGLAGRGETRVVSTLPFELDMRLPDALSYGDRLLLPVTVSSTLTESRAVEIFAGFGEGLQAEAETSHHLTLQADQQQTIYLPVLAADLQDSALVSLTGLADGLTDRIDRTVPISPRGYPQEWSASGSLAQGRQAHTFDLGETLEGTLVARVDLTPGPASTLIEGMEGMVRTPGGCFEQTSSTNYPNVLVLDYLRQAKVEPKLQVDRERVLKVGYDILQGYQVGSGGFETWGTGPGKEALSAYGLRQFTAMSRVWEGVPAELLEKDRNYLLSQRDGKGGFNNSGSSAHGYGSAPAEVLDTYITWALVSSGSKGLEAEVARVGKLAQTTKDPYVLALATGTLAHRDPSAAKAAARRLAGLQATDGSFPGASTSIMRSGGRDLEVESTSLATLALLQVGGHNAQVDKATGWLHANRQGVGTWGATQATVLALETLTEVAKASATPRKAGSVTVLLDGEEVGTLAWKAGSRRTLSLEGLEQHLTDGRHELTLVPDSAQDMPYTVALEWRARTPASDDRAALLLETALSAKSVPMGQTVHLDASLHNLKPEVVPSPIARIGLPAGLEAQVWQLEELVEKGEIAFFELRPREVTVYWDGVNGGSTHELDLDLVASFPGSFAGPASSAWPYYDGTFKSWAPELEVAVTP